VTLAPPRLRSIAATLLLVLAACGGSAGDPTLPVVTPPGVPGAPGSLSATAGNQSASLSWLSPASDGGSPITGYSVAILPATPSAVVTVSGTTASISGLANGTTYAFSVRATNAVGSGPASAPSGSVLPLASPPSIASVSPATGSSNGGTTVTLTGSGFVPGSGGSVVSIGGVTASVTASTSGTLVVSTPAHAAGPQSVTVTNPDGQSAVLAGAFSFVAPPATPAPLLSGLSPASGPGVGGTVVTLAGTGFVSPVSVRFGGTAATVSAQTANSIVAVAPPHAIGLVDVVVTNPDSQSSTRVAAFDYVFPADPPPTLSSAAPAQGAAAGGTTVTLGGSGFVAPVTVAFGGASATVVSVSPGAVTVVTPPHAAGPVAIVVTNADTQASTLPAGFTFTATPVIPPPSLTGATPASGPTAGGITVALAGADFDSGAAVTFGGASAPVVSRTASTLTVTAPAHGAGSVDVVVTNGSGLSATLAGGFSYVAPPVLTSVNPATGPVAGGTSVTLAGSGFVSGASGSQVTIGGATATVAGRTASTLVVTTAAHPAGAQPVTVTNPDGQSATLAGAFTFVDPPPAPSAPTLVGLTPAAGPSAGGATVVLTGTNFVTGGIVTFGGVAATIVGPVLATQITVATPAHSPGAVDVTFLNPFTGQVASIALGYAYQAVPPVIDALSIRGAPPAGGTTLTILGSGFQPGVEVTFGGAPATGIVISDATPPRKYITLTTPPQPAGAGAFVDLIVRNPDGGSATSPGFHYGPPPTITSVSVPPPDALTNMHKGALIAIAGADFSVSTGVQVQIGNLAVIVSASANELVVEAPKVNPGTYRLVVTNHDGQFGVAATAFDIVYQGP
jgi:hypothetical protein